MKSEHREILMIPSGVGKLTVEIDSEACAAYVRVREGKIARTEVQRDDGPLVTVDLDSEGNVLGLEFVGVDDFTISSLLNSVPVTFSVPVRDQNVRYIPAPKLQPA